MPKVLELTRTLSHPPDPLEVPNVGLRTYGGTIDMVHWLRLRQRAFAREKLGVRAWDEADFQREFLTKPWWDPARMWFAETDEVAGSITLASRDAGGVSKPVVHWLMVDPRWRRHGIAKLLLRTLETTVWKMGQRQVWLETHSAWTKAEQFYRAMGYAETTIV